MPFFPIDTPLKHGKQGEFISVDQLLQPQTKAVLATEASTYTVKKLLVTQVHSMLKAAYKSKTMDKAQFRTISRDVSDSFLSDNQVACM